LSFVIPDLFRDPVHWTGWIQKLKWFNGFLVSAALPGMTILNSIFSLPQAYWNVWH